MKTDREKLIDVIKEWCEIPLPIVEDPETATEYRMAKRLANYLISRGVVIPVRCEECVYWDDDNICNEPTSGLVREYTNFDDFCSYGERKEEE